MRTVVLSLGLALLCLLRAEAGAAGLDRSKIAGKWYVVALASNSEFYLREKDRLKMVMASLSVLGPDKLKVSYAAVTPEGCRRRETIFKKTSDEGEVYVSEGGDRMAQVLDTDYKSYAVIFATRVKDGKTLHMLRLYSRRQEVSPAVMALFRRFAKEQSFTDEMIKMLPSQDECRVDEP
ncbi:extracellular fatty acid-binding protein-like [Anas platyrhynchos]|uniref:Lipocalin/cytosolic fatty-acid binding domain-containing protein n=3 Tax=Anas TaxID=8835 RepID=U3I3C7_ANAPP|nr:extracellular fatty acid-binding protein-like [Anas platyrhynchos]|eukprot:XP_005014850.1 extracellular fatty acid-binding protein-like [Anas platyrhynchos]